MALNPFTNYFKVRSERFVVNLGIFSALVIAFFDASGFSASVPSFRNDVLPVLTKVGCNSGACHGAAAGKNGFKLSLRGYDPDADYRVLTREALGRRIVKAAPAHSLVLLKPTLTIPHGGGKRFEVTSPEYKIIADWIASGAPAPSSADPILEGIAVAPSRVIEQPGRQIQLAVRARYSDGSERDVTRWVKFSSTNESVAVVDGNGLVKIRGSGEAAIPLWYSSKVSFARLTIPFSFNVNRAIFRRARRNNYIDDLVLKKLEELHIAPSQLSTDSEFVRRAFLDTLGILPTPEEVDRFVAEKRTDKRARLIDELLERPEFVDYWSYRWSDLLLVSSRELQRNAMWSYYGWVRKNVAENKPWDRLVHELLTATGGTLENGAANFYVLHQAPIDITESVSQAFLGMSITCARCHNHPMEKWTQNDYYGMANLFSRVTLKNRREPGDFAVIIAPRGDINHPRLGKPMLPRPLEGVSLDLNSTQDRRAHFSEWLIAPENPYFGRAIVNRVWANFMGRGLVDPVDDLRATNPASNDELFAALTRDFIQHGFDLKYLIRTILNSVTYQLSARTNETNAQDDRYYSHYLIRRLPAEVILDAISQVTGVPEEFVDYPVGLRALQLPDSLVDSYFLSSFGRPPRIHTCECERQDDSNLTQALHLITGKTLDLKLRKKGNIADQLLDKRISKTDLIDKVYRLALSRAPTPYELAKLTSEVDTADRQTVEDLLWSILTSKEFLFKK